MIALLLLAYIASHPFHSRGQLIRLFSAFPSSTAVMLLLFGVISFLLSQATAIWPIPATFQNGTAVVWVTPGLQVTYQGQNVWPIPLHSSFLESITEAIFNKQYSTLQTGGSASSPFTSQFVVESAVSRTLQVLFTQGLLPWKLFPRNELSEYEPSVDAADKIYITSLEIIQTGPDAASNFKPLAGELDESYNLTILADGTAKLSAVSHSGVIYGLETFTQLFYKHSSGSSAGLYTKLAPVNIMDKPRFPHRGMF